MIDKNKKKRKLIYIKVVFFYIKKWSHPYEIEKIITDYPIARFINEHNLGCPKRATTGY